MYFDPSNGAISGLTTVIRNATEYNLISDADKLTTLIIQQHDTQILLLIIIVLQLVGFTYKIMKERQERKL